MRIGLVCPYSMGVWGGVQQQVLGLARALRHRGHAAQVLAPCDGIPPEPWITPLGNSMPYVQNGSIAPLAPDPPAQMRALAAVWDERFDVVHLHEPLAPGATLTTLVVKPVPLVGTFHASGEIAAYRYMRPLLRRLVGRLDIKVAVSNEAARMARKHLGGEYEVLFNGVELDGFSSARGLLSKTDNEPQRPMVLFLARHEPRKGLEIFVRAAQRVAGDIDFVVGGIGPETDRLAALAADDSRIRFLGEVSEQEKIDLLQRSEVFCAPAIGGESFGVVLVEAMAAKTAVVASELAAFRAVAGDGDTVVFFPTGDVDALAGRLGALLGDNERRRRLGEDGYARAQAFSMNVLAEHYERIYERARG